MMSRWCSKHVEEWNKLNVKQKFCASSWLITKINEKIYCGLTYCLSRFLLKSETQRYVLYQYVYSVLDCKLNASVLRLSVLIGTASHPDMQKIRVIGFFLENRLHWQFEVGKKIFTNGCFRLHIYLCTNKTLLHNSLYVFENGGKMLSHK